MFPPAGKPKSALYKLGAPVVFIGVAWTDAANNIFISVGLFSYKASVLRYLN